MLLLGKFENMSGPHLIFWEDFSKFKWCEKEVEINISNIPFILMLSERVYPPLIMEYKSSKTWKGHFPRLNIALDCFR
jgi:hypothetical protein